LQQQIKRFEESVFLEQCFHSPFIDEETKTTLRKMFEPLLDLLKRGKEERLIKDIDTFWLMSFVSGTVNEMAKRIIYFSRKPAKEIPDTNFQLCRDGIKA